MEASLLDDAGLRSGFEDRDVDTLCPYCGVGCQTRVHVKDDKILYVDGRDGPANDNRLCVKGRFGFDYISHPHRLTKPLIRREARGRAEGRRHEIDPAEPLDATSARRPGRRRWMRAAGGLKAVLDARRPGPALAGFGSAKGSNEEAYLFQKLVRTGFGTNNVDHCTRLCHASSVAALMEVHRLGRGDRALHGGGRCRVHHRDRRPRPAQNHPVAATYLKQAAKRGPR